MEKIKIFGISNRENVMEIILEKNKDYYDFLFKMLGEFDERIPDLQDEEGNDPNILEEEDKSMFYGKDNLSIIEVIGKNRIFLFIKTKLRDKLSDFIQENCKFIKK